MLPTDKQQLCQIKSTTNLMSIALIFNTFSRGNLGVAKLVDFPAGFCHMVNSYKFRQYYWV